MNSSGTFIYQWTIFCFLCFFESCIAANIRNFPGMRIPYLNNTSVSSRHWSPWTEWSQCSRTCGGGVRTRTRVCRIRLMQHISSRDTCVGKPSEQELCSRENCSPHDKDFSEHQCSLHNGQAVRGKKIDQWFPFPYGENPCELQCWSKDRSVIYSFGKAVDGTACPASSAQERALCVNGRCSPIDCAGNIGLVKKHDKCGVCGGDNSTCIKYENIFWRRPRNKIHSNGNKDIHYDYEEIFTIPVGATNILVREASRTNFLALSDHKGNYFINGNWRVQTPGQFIVHGSEFMYNRTWDGVEFLSSPGPTRQILIIFVLGSGDIPTIHYEYWISTISKHISPHHLKRNSTVIPDEVKNRLDFPSNFKSPAAYDLQTNGKSIPLPKPQGYNSYYHRNEILKSVPSWSIKRQSAYKRSWNKPFHVQNNVTSTSESNNTNFHHYYVSPGQYGTSWRSLPTKASPNVAYLFKTSPKEDVSIEEIVPLTGPGRPNGTSAQMGRSDKLYQYEVSRETRKHTMDNSSTHEKLKNERKSSQKSNKRKLKLPNEQSSRNRRKKKSSNDSCSRCSKVKEQTKNFCLSEFVLRAVILATEKQHQSVRFEIEVIRSYKNKMPILPREYLWTSGNCQCPKIRAGREYILMGHAKTFGNQRESRLVVDENSFVRKYSPKRARTMLRLVRDQSAKCRKFYKNKF